MAEINILINKLDEFIRKYYKNKLMRGLLWTFSILAVYYLIIITSEYVLQFNQTGRTVLFFTFLAITVFLFFRLIFIPILQLIKIGKVISYVQAAVIIGNHFPEIQDKLLNALQLIKKNESGNDHSELLTASIEQKTAVLKVFRFTKVIDLRKNLRYIRFALVPVFVFIIMALFEPKIISDPTSRILQFNKQFARQQPFKIIVLNHDLNAIQQEDLELQIEVTGNEIPIEFFIRTKDVTYKMVKKKGFVFTHLFKSLQENINFRITAGDFASENYEIRVFPKPILLSFSIETTFPSYINKQSETTENIGDFIIPEGSVVKWKFFTKDVNILKFRLGDKEINLSDKQNTTFSYTAGNLQTSTYCLSPVNDNILKPDSLVYRITVIRDVYPSIIVSETGDSALNGAVFFNGILKDDYGFTKLTFNYSLFLDNDTSKAKIFTESIPIENNVNNQLFYYKADLVKLMPKAGMNIRYFFEIWDNDGMHGPKMTKSEVKTITTPSIEELIKLTNKNEKIMNDEMEKGLNESEFIRKTMDELNKKMVEQSSISWQEKHKIEDLIKANQAIEEKVKEAIKRNEENIANEEKYLETSERITEKQKQLNRLMEELLSDDLKKIIEELQDLLKKVDKEKLGQLMEKMKVTNEELETQLDRNLALMKQVEFERKLEALSNELRKTAEKQENLAIETGMKLSPIEKLLDQQKKINEKTDSISQQINNLKTEGQKLETPADLGNTEAKQDSIRKNQEKSKISLEGKNTKDAEKSQKEAAKQMSELADQMEMSQQENEEEQLEEDAENLRMILENLIRLSFEQENLIGLTRVISRSDPRFPEIVVKQREFGVKLTVVEDSLISIAKRQLTMKPFVSKEIGAIRQNIELTLLAMDNRNINDAVAKQQYTMTSINNLAVLLNESLERMKEQMSSNMQSKGGKKSCKNSSGKEGRASVKGMKGLQNQIGQQLQKLKEGMDAKSGKSGGKKAANGGINKEIARLAAQQEALRNEMKRYQDEMGSRGLKEQGSLNEAVREMEKIEMDLINKNVTQETMRRQQEIMTRLLESEKAEQIRDQEEKRESTESKNNKISNPVQNFKYNMKRKASFDNIQLFLPVLSSFYKSKVNSYIVKIGY